MVIFTHSFVLASPHLSHSWELLAPGEGCVWRVEAKVCSPAYTPSANHTLALCGSKILELILEGRGFLELERGETWVRLDWEATCPASQRDPRWAAKPKRGLWNPRAGTPAFPGAHKGGETLRGGCPSLSLRFLSPEKAQTQRVQALPSTGPRPAGYSYVLLGWPEWVMTEAPESRPPPPPMPGTAGCLWPPGKAQTDWGSASTTLGRMGTYIRNQWVFYKLSCVYFLPELWAEILSTTRAGDEGKRALPALPPAPRPSLQARSSLIRPQVQSSLYTSHASLQTGEALALWAAKCVLPQKPEASLSSGQHGASLQRSWGGPPLWAWAQLSGCERPRW